MSAGFLRDPVLAAWDVEHGFGLRGTPEPGALARPRQVHGAVVAHPAAGGGTEPAEADAIVCSAPAQPIGILTADCLPVLLAADGGAAVAAVHAGWRGLAAGVVAAGVEALRAETPGARLRAALGPHIGACCYEVDAPVLERLAARFGSELQSALTPSRPGHWRLALAALARIDLLRAGLAREAIGSAAVACTRCDPERFHSHRRDGPLAGRLVSYIVSRVDTGRGAA